jgi:hypothetical protein
VSIQKVKDLLALAERARADQTETPSSADLLAAIDDLAPEDAPELKRLSRDINTNWYGIGSSIREKITSLDSEAKKARRPSTLAQAVKGVVDQSKKAKKPVTLSGAAGVSGEPTPSGSHDSTVIGTATPGKRPKSGRTSTRRRRP